MRTSVHIILIAVGVFALSGPWLFEQWRRERFFERDVEQMEENAAKSKNLIKKGQRFYFFHLADFENPRVVDGEVRGFKPGAKRQRFFTIQYRDGWFGNSCIYVQWDLSRQPDRRRATLSADECSKILTEKYLFGNYG